MNAWESVPFVSDGDGVDAESVNKSLRALVNRTERLSAELQSVTAGRALIERDCPVAPSVIQGTPVFWNDAAGRYEPALAAIAVAGQGTHGVLADTAYVAGVCLSKANEVAGDIITLGTINGLRILDVIDGAALPGPYYLSTTAAGKLVRATPANGVYVLSVLGNGAIRVNPVPLDTITAHVHMRLRLEHGTALSTGTGVPGWSTAFSAEAAPTGARYLYIPSATEDLNLVLPMLPDSAALAEVNGAATDTGVVVDGTGVWWISAVEPTEAVSVVINYTQSQLATSQSVVTSLDSGSNVIKVTGPLGTPATRGPLRLAFTGFNSAGGTDMRASAIKAIDEDGNMVSGPVVSGVVSGVASLRVATVNGVATILPSYSNDASLQGEPTIAVIRGGVQDTLQGIPYIGLPANQASSVAYRLELPILDEAAYELDLELMLLGTATGTLPNLSVSYSVVPSTLTSGLVQNLVAGTTSVTVSASAATKGTYVRGSLASKVPVTPGDMVFLTISRNDSSYAGSVGIMFAKYVISKKV